MQNIFENKSKDVLVLFSGGRDSSSVAALLALAGYKIKLYTYQAGLPELTGPRGDSAPDIRHKELTQAFPEDLDRERIIEGRTYLIRKLAIEKTNIEHVIYPIALALAVHANAVCYCLKNNINTIASGYSGYQAKEDRYIEQSGDFVSLTKEFLEEYDISYLTPVIEKSKLEVMDILERHNISSNSLENKSVFGGISFDKEKAKAFWKSSISLCREFIKNMQTS